MKNGHALLAPSAAERWMNCGGSVEFTKNMVNVGSDYADEGTQAHDVAANILRGQHEKVSKSVDEYIHDTFGPEHVDPVKMYVEYVQREAEGKILRVEQSLSLFPITGEAEAYGTSDAVIIDDEVLTIIDLKYGMGVRVEAKKNKQLLMYLAAARLAYSELGPFSKFKVSIVQPRLDHISEWEPTEIDLNEFVFDVKTAAPSALDGTALRIPSEKACQWCLGKAVCPELKDSVAKLVATGFDNLDKTEEADLSHSMSMAGMVEDWLRAVRAEVEKRLVSGIKVAGWKLVQGRMGARQWSDAKEVENLLKVKGAKQEEMYKFSLITPTQAEKLWSKKDIDLWQAAQALITQKEGGPSVAPSTDPRPAINSTIEAFDDIGDAA